ncbi:MAG: hypothetical protein HY791_19955 [Deltaproteobacteria bacterium]|nr:hypothetical protein [Deltaproteobacteria bacterium]
MNLDEPASVSDDWILDDSARRLRRRRVVLRAHGCKVATCSMCHLPKESVDPSVAVTPANWLHQLEEVIDVHQDIDVLTLFHNGNFFSEREVPRDTLRLVLGHLRATKIQRLVVESLPAFITEESLGRVRQFLGPKILLEVAVGLQCQDDFLRKKLVRSTCTRKSFLRALELTRHDGRSRLQVFVMFGIPFLTTAEALDETLRTLAWLESLGVSDPTICRLKVEPGTLAHELAKAGLYQAPTDDHLASLLAHALELTNDRFHPRVARSLIGDGWAADLVSQFNSREYESLRVACRPFRERCAPEPYARAGLEARVTEHLARVTSMREATER